MKDQEDNRHRELIGQEMYEKLIRLVQQQQIIEGERYEVKTKAGEPVSVRVYLDGSPLQDESVRCLFLLFDSNGVLGAQRNVTLKNNDNNKKTFTAEDGFIESFKQNVGYASTLMQVEADFLQKLANAIQATIIEKIVPSPLQAKPLVASSDAQMVASQSRWQALFSDGGNSQFKNNQRIFNGNSEVEDKLVSFGLYSPEDTEKELGRLLNRGVSLTPSF